VSEAEEKSTGLRMQSKMGKLGERLLGRKGRGDLDCREGPEQSARIQVIMTLGPAGPVCAKKKMVNEQKEISGDVREWSNGRSRPGVFEGKAC